jgi:hypothetical protein
VGSCARLTRVTDPVPASTLRHRVSVAPGRPRPGHRECPRRDGHPQCVQRIGPSTPGHLWCSRRIRGPAERIGVHALWPRPCWSRPAQPAPTSRPRRWRITRVGIRRWPRTRAGRKPRRWSAEETGLLKAFSLTSLPSRPHTIGHDDTCLQQGGLPCG